MSVVNVEMYSEKTDIYVVFHDVEDEKQKEQIKEWVDNLRGISDSFSRYMFVEDLDKMDDDNEDDYDDSIGTQSIIPEGKYKGMTIDDAYNMYGHYSLVEIMLSIRKMKSISKEENDSLYKEVILYAVRLIRQKETTFANFIDAYKVFLKDQLPQGGEKLEDWLKLPVEEQRVAYDALADQIVERMMNSLQKIA